MDLYQLEEKVNRLILLYSDLRKEHEEVRDTMEQIQKENARLVAENIDLLSKSKSMNLGQAFAIDKDIDSAVKEVEKVLREINQCIALLDNE